MEFIYLMIFTLVFAIVGSIWAIRSDKKDREREHTAAQHRNAQ